MLNRLLLVHTLIRFFPEGSIWVSEPGEATVVPGGTVLGLPASAKETPVRCWMPAGGAMRNG
jgi:hypothetical protein